MICRVCDGPGGDMHFGGISCRACAAFFRRFFHSKKMVIECTCSIRLQNSHPCRYCRIQKCLKIGMSAEKVQPSRDKHNWKCSNGRFISHPLSVDLINYQIPSRSTFHITCTIENWGSFEEKRAKRYGGSFSELNIFEASSYVQYEMDVIWQLVEDIFPVTKDLKKIDKNALLSNFVPKWWNLESVMDCAKDSDNLKTDQCEQVLLSFYAGAFQSGREMSGDQILRIFEPYYWYFYEKLILPIIQKSFEPTEFMAILWLAFFDSAYTNISEECSKVCQSVRNVILRELRGYQTDKNYADTRIVEAMEALPIVERAVEKFEEELLICEMNGVVIHEDFMEVMRQQRI